MSWRRLLAIIRKEAIQARRDRRTVVIVLIMPLLQLILLGYTTMQDIENIPMAVYDLSHSAASRGLISAFSTTGVFAITGQAASQDQVIAMLERGEVQLGLVIPADYADRLAAKQKAQVAFYLDGSNPIIALTALNSAQLIAQTRSTEIVRAAVGGSSPGSGGGVDVRARVWYNPDLTRANFIVPALIGLVMQSFMTQLVAGAIVREREVGTIEQLIATPLHSLELIVGKMVPYIGLALLAAIETLVVGLAWFKVSVHGSFLLLLVYCLFFLASMLAWAVFVSAIAHTDQEARMLNLLIALPSMYLSGMFFPRTSMPPILQFLGNLMPLTHFLIMIRAVVLKGVGIDMVVPQILGLGLFGIVTIWLASKSFKLKLA